MPCAASQAVVTAAPDTPLLPHTAGPQVVHDAWRPLGRGEIAAVLLSAITVVVVVIPRLPPGICYGDWGDLQLASATLGIMHPPGYPGFATLGWFWSKLPFVDPAYGVTLGCLASGVAALVLCVLMQIRLGVNAWIAAASALAFTAHRRMWTALIGPEVYIVSLALLTGAAYVMVRYALRGRRRDVFISTGLLGVAMANRTPVFLTLPFFMAAWWWARKRWEPDARQWLRTFGLATLFAALPGLYSLGYLYVRDEPETPYNYIEQINDDEQHLPKTSEGPAAKAERVAWLISGAQFTDMLTVRPYRIYSKLSRWLNHMVIPDPSLSLSILLTLALFSAMALWRRFRMLAWLLLTLVGLSLAFVVWCQFYGDVGDMALVYALYSIQTVATVAMWLLALGGAAATFLRSPTAGLVLLGLILGCMAYVSFYNIFGDAADILPLLFALLVFAGVAFSSVFPRVCSGRRRAVAVALALTLAGVTYGHAPYRYNTAAEADATGFLREADVGSLPRNAVVLCTWPCALPLWYAKIVLTPRPDITVINASLRRWQAMAADKLDRPIFADGVNEMWEGPTYWVRERNLWRLVIPK